ncbi:sugar lactone lactonase YvrE [Nocardioides ginsengisegetis]|uniref:Sugar lactone lactonase YvrE n=1 Tax=Nocardioides ginsengisegetis TaxID=661491 RepID=A0A7W3P9T5_9ACTN|nr:SMP-30/gluconolactonase/LRE family protein [Nocardioides ginsengisegetis]MBA8803757.1 sugar lactone lactonase YvrE [Nocardioides ginsengisegetis]
MTRPLIVVPVPGEGAEDVVIGTTGRDEGAVFTGTADGSIFRISHDARRIDRIARTGGRPLGLELDPDGRLLVCDAHLGVLRVDTASGAVEPVTDSVDGARMVFCNNAAIASDGTVWFSDSTRVHPVEHWRADFVENTTTGRLLRLTTDGTVETVLDDLRFANGVALPVDETFVVVAETAGRRLLRHWLAGPHQGTTETFGDDLPGYPDNIARGSDGLIWVTIASPRNALVERLWQGPLWVRKSVTRIPERLQPQPARTVRVQAYDDAGALVHDLDADASGYHMATGVREHDGRVWVGSIEEPAVAVLTP